MSKKTVAGLEIIGDFKGCNKKLLEGLTVKKMKAKISFLLLKHNLAELGSYFHKFDIGVTGVIALAESHIAFHTWPDEKYVSLNIYVCNYKQNNEQKARDLLCDLKDLFKPKKTVVKEMERMFY